MVGTQFDPCTSAFINHCKTNTHNVNNGAWVQKETLLHLGLKHFKQVLTCIKKNLNTCMSNEAQGPLKHHPINMNPKSSTRVTPLEHVAQSQRKVKFARASFDKHKRKSIPVSTFGLLG